MAKGYWITFYRSISDLAAFAVKDLAPCRMVAHVAGSVAKPGLAALSGMITHKTAVVAGHRPVRDLDVRHADRDAACAFSPLAAAGQLMAVER
jgi:hypothetical protein